LLQFTGRTDAPRGPTVCANSVFHTSAGQKTLKNAKRIAGVTTPGEDAKYHEHQIKRVHDPKRFADPHIRGGRKYPINLIARGEPIMAPLPNPMMAIPVASPGPSVNLNESRYGRAVLHLKTRTHFFNCSTTARQA
jgi:hypothetical protein